MSPDVASFVQSLARGTSGLRWYLREVTGESKWDQYLDECRNRGIHPTSRKDFERRRADHRECGARSRCC